MAAHEQLRLVAERVDEPAPVAALLEWSHLAHKAGIRQGERLLLALSGGRDSVALLILLAEARPQPAVRAVHIDHGWRGEEGAADAAACVARARELGVPCDVVRLDLSASAPSAEATARSARMRALVAAARATGHHTVLTAHHTSDAIEGLLLRWRRTGQPSGWLRPDHQTVVRGAWPGAPPQASRGEPAVVLVRPLAGVSRAKIDAFLAARGGRWREDSSNKDLAHARNAVRHELVPLLTHVGGAQVPTSLARLGAATLDLDLLLAAHVPLPELLPHVHLTRPVELRHLGARFASAPLAALAPGVREPVLARLLVRTSGCAPSAAVVDALARDLALRQRRRHVVAGGWHVATSAEHIVLTPPDNLLGPMPGAREVEERDLELDDGRLVLHVSVVALLERQQFDRERRDPLAPLWVRGAAYGDRIQEAPGRPVRALRRLLAELRVPTEERARVLVLVDAAGLVVGLL